MGEFTKGPWFAKINGKYNNSKNSWSLDDEESCSSESAPITLADGTVIGFAVASSDRYFSEDRVSGIAALMAEAPDLLKALEAAMAFIESHAADPDLTADMRAKYAALQDLNPAGVIARARGEA